MPLYGCILKRAAGLIKPFNSWIKLSEGLMKLANSLIKLSARNQEPRTKNQDSQKSFVENLGSWYLGGTKILNKTFLGILVLGSWFLADSLIKLFESWIKPSNSLIKLFESWIKPSNSLIKLSFSLIQASATLIRLSALLLWNPPPWIHRLCAVYRS